jgi:cell division protein FtsX
MIQGAIGGIIATILIIIFNSFLVDYITLLQVRRWPGGTVLVPIFSLLFAGIVIGWLGSRFATRRFVKKVELH